MTSMTRTHVEFALVDVFATNPLEGNPLAVVVAADGLSVEMMRRIAREFNQAETTFVLSPTRPEATHRLRSFTAAGKEATGGVGHHTLGAWWWLADSGAVGLDALHSRFVQEGGDQLLPVEIVVESGRPKSVSMWQLPPTFGPRCDDAARLALALRVSPSDLALDQLPGQVVSTGVAHLLVPVSSRAALNAARPDFARLGPLVGELGGEGCYLFTRDTVEADSAAHARFFNPTLGITEDIATGTAAGPLAAQLVACGLACEGDVLRIEQGDILGRPSRILVQVTSGGVSLSAACVVSGRGTLRLA